MVGDFRKSSRPASNYLPISAPRAGPGMVAENGGSSINTQILTRAAGPITVWVWIVRARPFPLLLLAPAIWNGYPLLQWDTGGYLARWYEGYLVPSRSTVFGLYLHFGEDSGFWLDLGIQALATLWILQLTLRVFGMARPSRLVAISLVLILTTALPWLASMLLTDIFAGLSVLSLFMLVAAWRRISTIGKMLLFVFTAFAGATHSATLRRAARPVLRRLDRAAVAAARALPVAGLVQGSLTIVAGAAMLLAANFALSGQLAWTPGGYGVAFGRMMQDGIVARYLRDSLSGAEVEALPLSRRTAAHRRRLPVGQQHVRQARPLQGPRTTRWATSRCIRSRNIRPGRRRRRIVATARATDRRRDRRRHHGWIPHTYGIIEHYIPAQLAPMRAARQQHGDIDFAAINRIHVPVALGSMLLVVAIVAAAHVAAAARRSRAACRHRQPGAARQRLHLRRDIGTARPLWRADGLDRDIGGADRGRSGFRRSRRRRAKIHFRR